MSLTAWLPDAPWYVLVFSVIFGTGSPNYMIHLSARIHDKTALRATSRSG